MNLLQHSWSDMLLLDHIHQRMHNSLADDTQLPNGQRFDLLTLALLGVTSASDQLHQLTMKLAELKFDTIDYTCLKFLLLLNPGKFIFLIHSGLLPTRPLAELQVALGKPSRLIQLYDWPIACSHSFPSNTLNTNTHRRWRFKQLRAS